MGVPGPGELALTVAVQVTFCPRLAKSGEAVATVVVPSLFTTWLIAGEIIRPDAARLFRSREKLRKRMTAHTEEVA